MIEKRYLPKKIISARISLQKHHVDLAQKMYNYVIEDRDRLAQFLPWPNQIKTVDDEIAFINLCSEAWENYSSSQYGIFRNSDDEYLGNVGAFKFSWQNNSCEIGYWILGKFEGKGYMSEASTALESTLRAVGFNRIIIRCDQNNERSKSIPKRLGYKLEGIEREAILVNDNYGNLEVFSKINSDS